MIHQPDRVESGGLGRERAFDDAIEPHPYLRQIEPEPHTAHATFSRMELAGVRAIVTGGAGGIGQSCARASASERLPRGVLDIATPAGDFAFPVDVADEDAVVDGVAAGANRSVVSTS